MTLEQRRKIAVKASRAAARVRRQRAKAPKGGLFVRVGKKESKFRVVAAQ
jgi:hypothetical protein